MKLQTICFALALAACQAPQSPTVPVAPDTLTPTRAAQSTFRVNIKEQDPTTLEWVSVSSGTAWIVMNGTESLLLTAGHVCRGEDQRFSLTSPAGLEYDAVVVKVHSLYDLCLMRGYGANAYDLIGPALRLSDEMPAYDTPIMAVGAPLGVYGCYGGSSVDACGMAPISRGFMGGGNLVSMPMYGGNSGSAVFTSGGVFGVLVEGYRQFPLLSFVEPIEHIRDFLDQ